MKRAAIIMVMTVLTGHFPGLARAQDALVPPVGCAAFVRVDWRACVSSVIYRCEGAGDVAWVQSRVVGQYVDTALSYDTQGDVIRQLGVGRFADGPVAEISDGFDFDLLQQSRGETIALVLGDDTLEAEFFLDRGFRFHTTVPMMRADLIGRSSAPGREDVTFDQSAYFLPEIPVMMLHDDDPEGVIWAAEGVDLAEGQQCTNL